MNAQYLYAVKLPWYPSGTTYHRTLDGAINQARALFTNVGGAVTCDVIIRLALFTDQQRSALEIAVQE